MKTAFFVALVAVFSYSLGNFILFLGINKRAYNHVPGECSSVGSFEDGVAAFETAFDGTVFISAGLCVHDCEKQNGRILTYNVDNKSAWELIVKDSNMKLNPGGISLSPSRNKVHVMVVNHGKRDSVQTFHYKKDTHTLKYLRTVRNKLFNDLIDVAAVDRMRFYATSHTYFQNSYLNIAEKIFSLSTGSILFFDGKQTRHVYSIPTPTGVVYDYFRSLLFVASLSLESIRVFEVAKDFNLTFSHDIPLNCAPYSLWRDIDNSLVTACHPVKLRYFMHILNSTNPLAPTQILRVHYRSNITVENPISQLYSNDGATVSAALAAVRSGKVLLIGSEEGMLSCDISTMM